MATNEIVTSDVEEMIKHWLSTPINTYLGSDYGFDRQALLFQPLSSAVADEMIAKLKRDIPLLGLLDSSAINLYSYTIPPDRMNIVLTVGSSSFNIS